MVSPLTVSGLVGYYAAGRETAWTDDQSMTALTDFSGVGNHASSVTGTPKWRSTAGSGSTPALEFVSGGTNYFTLPNLLSGASAGEVMVTIKIGSTSDNTHHWKFGTSGDNNHFTFSNGLVYDDFGSTLRQGALSPPVAPTSWRRYSVWSAASDWACRLDETAMHSTSVNTVGWHSSPKIGSWVGPTGGTMRYGCLLLWNKKLSTQERADMAAFLTAHPDGVDPPAGRAPTIRSPLRGLIVR